MEELLATNGSLQSLAQLAVALNLGFAAVVTIFRANFSSELNSLSRLKAKIDLLEETLRSSSDTSKKVELKRVVDLKQDLVVLYGQAVDFADSRKAQQMEHVTIAALLAALASLALLICFSFVPNLPQLLWSRALTLVLFAPVLVFVIVPLVVDRPKLQRLKEQRDGISDRYSVIRAAMS